MQQTLEHPGALTFDVNKLQRVIAQASGIEGSLDEQLTQLSEAIAPDQKLVGNPLYRGVAVRVVRDLVKSLGYSNPTTMVDLFMQVMSAAAADSEEIAFQRVRMRSIGAEKEILAEEGGALSDAEFAEKLGVRSRTTIQNYREQNRIFAVPWGVRNRRYPAWQIHRKELLPGLAEALVVLIGQHHLDPLNVALFFLTKAEALEDERPLDLLRRKEVDEVIAHAVRYGDRT